MFIVHRWCHQTHKVILLPLKKITCQCTFFWLSPYLLKNIKFVRNFKNVKHTSFYNYNIVNDVSNVLMWHYITTLICRYMLGTILKQIKIQSPRLIWKGKKIQSPRLTWKEKKLHLLQPSSFLAIPPQPYPTLIFFNLHLL